MKLALFFSCALLFFCALLIEGQPPSNDAARLHADVVKLVAAGNTRAGLEGGLKSMLDQARVERMQACGGCDPAFGVEWAKRMAERIRVDEILAIYARVFEKHFNDAEVRELTGLQPKAGSTLPRQPSDALRKKMDVQIPIVQSEIRDATAQWGTKLGDDVEMEIRKKHPEYFKAAPPPPRR